MLPLLQIKNLRVTFSENGTEVNAVSNSSFTISRGSMVAIVGESGSGKSITSLSILQLLPKQATVSGEILFSEDENHFQDLLKLTPGEVSNIRGNKISMIFQEPMTSLNPVYTCGNQVMEALIQHKKISKEEARQKTIELFELVSLPEPTAMLKRYPHQLSGGQKQRVMIAMAMCCNPALLIADEPTTALDVRVQKSILMLLKKLQQQNKMSVLLITHDLSLVADYADEVIVMYKGSIAEQGETKTILLNPQHNYTKALLACKPTAGSKGKKLPVISDFLNPTNNITATQKNIKNISPIITNEVVLNVQDLKVYFTKTKNIFGKPTSMHKAVDGVSFTVNKNETIGLVGESGCGKTTLGRAILHLINPSSGKIILNGKDISTLQEKEWRLIRKNLQIVFQDPYGSLNPRISIGDAIMEPLTVHHYFNNQKERKEKVVSLLEKVNLNADHFNRYPHQFSGGQRQRICIARALALEPSFLVFDESVSALDVSVQAQVLNLINELKADLNFTAIFISHDLSVVHYISDRILVMNKGKIVEEGSADNIYFNPKDIYTQQLIESIPGQKKSF
ncbi:MAG: ABC transporter ATP-binding protein [Bacteroidetes bacterium]|nr:ABC transporter ATP-binding protein [Bacteroidota bacterium]MBS1756191.1 ABC transporter ATP-binding protein [Bacteroidota bacterium]